MRHKIAKQMIQGIIFDMDGVLVDNRDIHIEAFQIFARRYGFEIPYEKMRDMFGKGNDEILPDLLPAELIREKGVQALSNEKEAIYREIFAEKITPTAGLVDFLREVRAHGIRTAIGSSGQRANVDFVLERCRIADQFDAMVNGDMVTRCKPDPEIFLLAAQLLNLPPANCLVIEDAFAGIEAADRAGMPVIAMATTYSKQQLGTTKHNLLVSDFTELNYDKIVGLSKL